MFRGDRPLYPYQERAASIMAESDVLLGFEMGTGKTPTTLAAIERMRGDVFDGPGTVVVPASLKWQWAREVAKFTDQEAVVIDGTAKQREVQYCTVRRPAVGYMVMGYDTFVRDWDKHNHLARGFLVLDEATAIKNFASKRTRHIKDHRNLYKVKFALTGTPIENGKAEEVFSILEFVDPRILGRFWDFEKKYVRRNSMGWIEGYRNLKEFHETIRPYVLRATHKEPEVAKYLPKVMHLDPVMVRPDRATRRLLNYIEGSLLSDLDSLAANIRELSWDENPGMDHPDGRVMSKVQTMRMLLGHPGSVRESAASFNDPTTSTGSEFAATLVAEGRLEGISATPKMDMLEQYLTEFLDRDHRNKAVVFASFVHVASNIHTRFRDRSVIFTGSMSPKQRDAAKQQFASDPSCRVFVSTDAGGYGLDLPEANLLINFDLPWQAGLLKQRSARIKRASSRWPYVVVQDFLVEGSIEERMAQMLAHKIAVSSAIIDGEGIQKGGGIVSEVDTLRAFLADNNTRSIHRAS